MNSPQRQQDHRDNPQLAAGVGWAGTLCLGGEDFCETRRLRQKSASAASTRVSERESGGSPADPDFCRTRQTKPNVGRMGRVEKNRRTAGAGRARDRCAKQSQSWRGRPALASRRYPAAAQNKANWGRWTTVVGTGRPAGSGVQNKANLGAGDRGGVRFCENILATLDYERGPQLCHPREEPALDLLGGGGPGMYPSSLDSRLRGNDCMKACLRRG
jgi:hypothetical protein